MTNEFSLLLRSVCFVFRFINLCFFRNFKTSSNRFVKAEKIFSFALLTSRFFSGPVTVISLMTGYAVDRLSNSAIVFSVPGNGTDQNSTIEYEAFVNPVLIATTLAFVVGLIQVGKGNLLNMLDDHFYLI